MVFIGNMSLSNGQTLYLGFAVGQAINTSPVADTVTVVASGTHTQTDFSVATDAILTDFITDDTAGAMELFNVTDGRRTGLTIETTAKYATTVVNRQVPRIGFRKGKVYRWLMTVAGA